MPHYAHGRGLLLIAIGMALSACGGGGDTAATSPNPASSSFALTRPAAGSYINSGNSASTEISGSCDGHATSINVTGAVTASADCRSGVWSMHVSFDHVADGNLIVTATEVVTSGSAPPPVSVAVVKDTLAPLVAINQPAANAFIAPDVAAAVPVGGSCNENGRSVNLIINGGGAAAAAVCTNSQWTSTLDVSALGSGTFTVTASLSDAAGNPGTHSIAANKVSVTVRSNQTIGSYPHRIDSYIPSNATTAMVFLHGGGGQKEQIAHDLGIKEDSTTTSTAVSASGQSWLVANQVAMIFPQGQSVSGNAFTWNNHFMISGQDDQAFLEDLASSIRSDPTFAGITRIYLAGHSNGGIMANRMWCTSPASFDAYGALAGPPSSHFDANYLPTPVACNPTSAKPYIGIFGSSDSIFQVDGNLTANTWTLRPLLYALSPSAYADSTPQVMNELVFHTKRVALRCATTPAAPATSGQISTYSDCNGSIQLWMISQTTVNGLPSGGDHCLVNPVGGCLTTLAGATGLDYKSALMDFLRSY